MKQKIIDIGQAVIAIAFILAILYGFGKALEKDSKNFNLSDPISNNN